MWNFSHGIMCLAVLQLIVHEVKFQKILHCSISHIMGKSLFQWCDTKRSWELFLSIDEPHDCDSFHLKGIFFLPGEVCGKVWNKIAYAGDQAAISRYISKIPVTYSEYQRLLEGKWLNDEIINAYISLMGNSPGTLVLNTYLWQAIDKTRRNDRTIQTMVRANISLVWLDRSSWGKKLSGGKRALKTKADALNLWQKIIFPVHWDKNHWIAIILVPQEKTISIYDSLGTHTGKQGRKTIMEVWALHIVQRSAHVSNRKWK